mmetsp:Transcript_107887/g.196403  ORF Transcript_107887/g.196403 Transcript_107887/m.196403 type:complete len:379 (-) Transcript_107887:60-1196(-)
MTLQARCHSLPAVCRGMLLPRGACGFSALICWWCLLAAISVGAGGVQSVLDGGDVAGRSTPTEDAPETDAQGTGSPSNDAGTPEFYKRLGVEKTATIDEIDRAWRKKSLKMHPDKKGGNKEKFQELSEAYAVLKDPDERAKYDQFGEGGVDPVSAGPPPPAQQSEQRDQPVTAEPAADEQRETGGDADEDPLPADADPLPDDVNAQDGSVDGGSGPRVASQEGLESEGGSEADEVAATAATNSSGSTISPARQRWQGLHRAVRRHDIDILRQEPPQHLCTIPADGQQMEAPEMLDRLKKCTEGLINYGTLTEQASETSKAANLEYVKEFLNLNEQLQELQRNPELYRAFVEDNNEAYTALMSKLQDTDAQIKALKDIP